MQAYKPLVVKYQRYSFQVKNFEQSPKNCDTFGRLHRYVVVPSGCIRLPSDDTSRKVPLSGGRIRRLRAVRSGSSSPLLEKGEGTCQVMRY